MADIPRKQVGEDMILLKGGGQEFEEGLNFFDFTGLSVEECTKIRNILHCGKQKILPQRKGKPAGVASSLQNKGSVTTKSSAGQSPTLANGPQSATKTNAPAPSSITIPGQNVFAAPFTPSGQMNLGSAVIPTTVTASAIPSSSVGRGQSEPPGGRPSAAKNSAATSSNSTGHVGQSPTTPTPQQLHKPVVCNAPITTVPPPGGASLPTDLSQAGRLKTDPNSSRTAASTQQTNKPTQPASPVRPQASVNGATTTAACGDTPSQVASPGVQPQSPTPAVNGPCIGGGLSAAQKASFPALGGGERALPNGITSPGVAGPSQSQSPQQGAQKPPPISYSQAAQKKAGSSSSSLSNGPSNPSREAAGSASTSEVTQEVPSPVPVQVNWQSLGDFLKKYNPTNYGQQLQRRGIKNQATWCYFISVMQALYSVSPFVELCYQLSKLQERVNLPPLCALMVELLQDYTRPPENGNKHPEPLEGQKFREILRLVPSKEMLKSFESGSQEDASEFLTALLQGLTTETGKAMASVGAASQNEDAEGQWTTVSRVKKNAYSENFSTDPVKRIFFGSTKDFIFEKKTSSNRETEATEFDMLQLGCGEAHTLEDALSRYFEREELPDEKGDVKMRQILLEHLPPALTISLKNTVYAGQGQKLDRKIKFPVQLVVKPEWLSSKLSSAPEGSRRYRLSAVIFHSGKQSSAGHYFTYSADSENRWILTDDQRTKSVSEEEVVHYDNNNTTNAQPHIFIYRLEKTLAHKKHNV